MDRYRRGKRLWRDTSPNRRVSVSLARFLFAATLKNVGYVSNVPESQRV